MARIDPGSVRSYEEADKYLGRGQERETGQRGTVVKRETDTQITVWYHDTPVVTYYKPGTSNRVATIDTAGWKTPTTLARINEYAPEGVVVWAERGETVEIVMLTDKVNDVVGYPMVRGPYHMSVETPARR